MTAHSPRAVVITPDLVARFEDYYRWHPAWGVLHVVFADGNWSLDPEEHGDHTDEERFLVAIVRQLSLSQRRRLCAKVERSRRP